MTEHNNIPVTAHLIIPMLIKDIHSHVQPVAEIHKVFELKFHKVQTYGTVYDIRLHRKTKSLIIGLDDTTGRINAYVGLPKDPHFWSQKDTTMKDFVKIGEFTKEQYLQKIINHPRILLGSRVFLIGRPRMNVRRKEYELAKAEITFDDGPDRAKEIAFRMKLVDFYTNNFKKE
ncbi:hypothetical protein ACFFRR_003211 [Megaselia abdita]